MVMMFFTVLFVMVLHLFLSIFWLWLSNHNETIVFKLFNLISSEFTYFFRRFWVITVLCLSLLSCSLFLKLGFILAFLTFTLSSVSVVVSSVITFASIRPIVISVVPSFSLFFFNSRLFCWLYSRNRLSFLDDGCSFLLNNNLRNLSCFFNNWLRLALNNRNLRNLLLRSNFDFSYRLLKLDLWYFSFLGQDIIHNFFLVNLNILYLIISMLLHVSSERFLEFSIICKVFQRVSKRGNSCVEAWGILMMFEGSPKSW